jgi:hypothetical protein
VTVTIEGVVVELLAIRDSVTTNPLALIDETTPNAAPKPPPNRPRLPGLAVGRLLGRGRFDGRVVGVKFRVQLPELLVIVTVVAVSWVSASGRALGRAVGVALAAVAGRATAVTQSPTLSALALTGEVCVNVVPAVKLTVTCPPPLSLPAAPPGAAD